MIKHIVISERLLQHHQIELIERLEQWHVAQRISRIRIAHQTDFRKALAHAPDNVEIPTRLNLDLNSLVAGIHFFLDLLDQLFGRVLNPDRYATGNFGLYAAEMFPEWDTRTLCFQVPTGC